MAIATAVQSFVTALGPIKVEVVKCTMASTTDTYTSKLQRPIGAIVHVNSTSTANPVYSLSGRTFTITETNISASTVILIIFGF